MAGRQDLSHPLSLEAFVRKGKEQASEASIDVVRGIDE